MNTAEDHAEAAAIRDERYRDAAQRLYPDAQFQIDAAVEPDTVTGPGSPVEVPGAWVQMWAWIPQSEVEE